MWSQSPSHLKITDLWTISTQDSCDTIRLEKILKLFGRTLLKMFLFDRELNVGPGLVDPNITWYWRCSFEHFSYCPEQHCHFKLNQSIQVNCLPWKSISTARTLVWTTLPPTLESEKWLYVTFRPKSLIWTSPEIQVEGHCYVLSILNVTVRLPPRTTTSAFYPANLIKANWIWIIHAFEGQKGYSS